MGGEEFGRLPAAGGGRLHVLPELDRRLRVVAGARHIFEADAVGLRLGRARERELAHAGRHLHQRADRALAEAGRAERGLDSGALRHLLGRVARHHVPHLVAQHGGSWSSLSATCSMPLLTPILPPGRAKALGVGSSKSWNSQSMPSAPLAAATRSPICCTRARAALSLDTFISLLICCQASAPSWLACPSSMSMSWLRPVTGAWVQPAAMPAVIRKTPRQLAKRDMVRFPRRDADRGPRTSHLRPTCGTAGDHGSSRAGMPFLCSAVSGGNLWKPRPLVFRLHRSGRPGAADQGSSYRSSGKETACWAGPSYSSCSPSWQPSWSAVVLPPLS